jgi:PAS domain S-box-containing protein
MKTASYLSKKQTARHGRGVFSKAENVRLDGELNSLRASMLETERYRLVIEAMNDGVWEWDMVEDKSFLSERYLGILGLPKDTVLTQDSFSTLVHPEDLDRLQQAFHGFLEQDEFFEIEFRMRHTSGGYRHCWNRGRVLRDTAGAPIRLVGVLSDITAQKRALQREQLTRRVTELSNENRDLNTILTRVAHEVGEFFEADRAFVTYLDRGEHLYDVKLVAQYARSQDLPLVDWSNLSPKLVDTFMRNRTAEDLIRVFRLTSPEEHVEVLKQSLDRQNLTPAEKEALCNEALARETIHSILRVPVIYRGIPYGSITLQQCLSERSWQDDEVALIQEIATQVGTVLYQAELHEQEQKAKAALQNSLDRERLIREVTEIIGRSFDIDLILKTLAEELGRYLNVDRCNVSRFYFEMEQLVLSASAQYCRPGVRKIDPEDIELIIQSVKHFTPQDVLDTQEEQIINIPNQEQYIEYVKARMAVLNLPGITSEKVVEWVYKYETQSTLRVNIRYRGIPYGSITVNQCSHNREWQPEEVELVKIIAEHAGSAIYQAELYNKEQRAREEAEIANRRKSQFLANMSHELRTPLNAIIGYSDMLKSGLGGTLNPKQHRYTDNVITSGRHLLNMVNDILDLSKVEAGKLELNLEWIDLEIFLRETAYMVKDFAMKRQVGLNIELHPEVRGIQADSQRLRQALLNLLSNAIKFNREQGCVNIRVQPVPQEEKLLFEVEDNGIGIPAKNISELFSEFYQVDNKYARQYEGTGLGLALTKRLVELHGGHISVESTEGIGSTFRFTLPGHNPEYIEYW